jgi:CopG family transcriptional regulator, nickel-responsive regulator
MTVDRFGVSMPGEQLEAFDRLLTRKGYDNRSEAVRDMVRQWMVEDEWEHPQDDSEERVAVAVIVYDHDRADLSQKLTHVQHEQVGVVVTALHLHLDSHNCLEVILLRGAAGHVHQLGRSIIATRGVKFGKLVLATTGAHLT